MAADDRLSSLPTRAAAVLAELRRLIVSGELAGGVHLRQREVAERFGVSTTPVREAFTALAREGLVQQDTHRGVMVLATSPDDVRENFEMRAALESFAAELAAQSITEHELCGLDALLLEMRAAAPAYLALNSRFHAIVNGAAQRPQLLALITSLRAQAGRYHAQLVPSASYVAAVHAEHEEIVAALRARVRRRAARAVAAHILHARDEVLGAMVTTSR